MRVKKFLAAAAIVSAAVLVLPGVSSAQVDTASLQAQIAALLAQIQVLQAQLGQTQGGGGTTTQWCHTFNANLGIGSYGSEVQALIIALNKSGLVPSAFDTANSQIGYDETVASYVTAFQEKYRSEILTPAGLSAGTGYVGTKTRAKLNSLYGCGTKINLFSYSATLSTVVRNNQYTVNLKITGASANSAISSRQELSSS